MTPVTLQAVLEESATSKDDVFVFLDDLREAGVTNMWGGAQYVTAKWPGITRIYARELLLAWIDDERPK